MRILLVEDEPDLGSAIKRTLNQHNYVVDLVMDGNEAWEYLQTQTPEYTPEYTMGIFDWLLPGLSGIELLQRMRRKDMALPTLMLTAKDTLEDKILGLDAGADDYLIKPFSMAELLARLRALQRRSPQLMPQQLQVGNLTLDYGMNTVFWQAESGEPKIIFLTHKEFQLLEYFMKHPHQIVNRDRILSQIWEWGAEPMSNVVAAQVRLLRRKLAEYGCENWIETVYGLGYRFSPDV